MSTRNLWTFLLLSALAGCAASTRQPPQKTNMSIDSPPRLVSGQKPLRLGLSNCELPAGTVYIIQFAVQADGQTAGPVRFVGGTEPTECIRHYLEGIVAQWLFHPATQDGQPVAAYYNRTVNTPR